ncbi:MAG TPA: SCO family protein [Gemmatimonadaceae bacterium]|nr:SCO family protein [Gemmatimonadaceae bacterium]
MNARWMLAALLAIGCTRATARRGLPYYTNRTLTPVWIDSIGARDTVHRIGDFTLVDQRGRTVGRATVAHRIYVASFFYAECQQLCPKLRSQLQRVQAAFQRDTNVMILSHTIAPEADSVSVLRRYATENHLDSNKWLLLTGARSEIERLARDEYYVELRDSGGKTTGRLLHTETFALVDRDGHIRGLYDGSLSYDVSQLIDDIRTLERE